MNQYLFMRDVLRVVSEGLLFSRAFAYSLRVLAALLGAGALVAWVRLWKEVWRLDGTVFVGGMLFQLLYVIAAYMVIHTMWIRASTIAALGRSDFTVVPIVSICLRMVGEIYACISVAVGVGGGVFLLFGGYGSMAYQATRSIPGMGWSRSLLPQILGSDTGSSFVAALLFAAGSALGALVWLTLFYLAAELLVVQFSMARNLLAIRELAERGMGIRVEAATAGGARLPELS